MRQWLYGAILGALIAISVVVSLKGCNEHSGASEQEINRVLEVHHDTIVCIYSVLKYKVKVVHDLAPDAVDSAFDSAFPADTFYIPSDTIKQVVTVYQEKRCIEAVDSLSAYKQIVHVDSSVIDSLAKIGKKKEPTDWQTLGLIGAGGVILGFILTR